MKQNKSGITLIALIITIIIMLILAGVTISIIVNGGLFTTASNAAIMQKFAGYKEEAEISIVGQVMTSGGIDIEDVNVIGSDLLDFIPDLQSQDIPKLAILDGKIVYIGEDENEIQIVRQLGYLVLSMGEVEEQVAQNIEYGKLKKIMGTTEVEGTSLVDRNFTNMTTWKIVTEIAGGTTKNTYGTGWILVTKGTMVDGIGILQYDHIMNNTKTVLIKWDKMKHTYLAYGANLAVTDGLVYNADPANMSSGSDWGDAILHGFNTPASGWTPTALIFDGINDYIEIPTTAAFDDGLTFEFYGNVFGLGNSMSYVGLFCKQNPSIPDSVIRFVITDPARGLGWNILFNIGKRVAHNSDWYYPVSQNNFLVGWEDFEYNQDVYFVITFDGVNNIATLYKNGNYEQSTVFSEEYWPNALTNLNNSTYQFVLGRSPFGSESGYHYLKGAVYSCRLYNKALTEEEVLENYNATVSYHELLVNE